MEISESSLTIFHSSRILALAPYRIGRDSKGRLAGPRWSPILTLYSIALFGAIVLLTFYGLIYDYHSKRPIRMKTPTSKVVTSLDVLVVVCACFSGVLCGIIGLKNSRELNKRLQEADETLSMYANGVRDRWRGIALALTVFVGITITLGLDIWSWHRIASKRSNSENNVMLNLQGYLPFYFLYYILMALHVQIAQSALGIGRRYRRLNIALNSIFIEKGVSRNTVKIVRIPMRQELNATTRTVDVFSQKKTVSAIAHAAVGNGATEVTREHALIERLAHIHASLAKAVDNVSFAFGLAIIAILASCLLHLVGTSYFLIMEIFGDNDKVFGWLQILWLSVHIIRLILIVEPCHITYIEAKATRSIVCDILRICQDSTMRDDLTMFWQQLAVQEVRFSAFGMCTIDREIYTSFCSAIATYLVILIQFQKTDG